MRAQIQPGTSSFSPRFAAPAPRMRYLSIDTQIAAPTGSTTIRATVMLSSSSSPPRIRQHTPYSAPVSDRFAAVAAWYRMNGDFLARSRYTASGMTGPRKIAPRYPNVADVMSPSRTGTGPESDNRARPSSDAGFLVIGPRVSSGALVTLRAHWRGDEIDELFDPAEEFGFEVGVRGHRAQDALPGRRHLRRPPDGPQHAFLPWLPGRDVRPGLDADRGRPYGGPDIDERMAHDQHVGRPHAGRDPGLLGACHQVVHEHAEAAARRGGEIPDDGGQVVDALQVLHDDADIAQVVAPDLLDQLGVVLALDVDPARAGDLGPGPLACRRGHGPGRGPGRPGGRGLGGGRDERDRLAVDQEGGRGQREDPPPAVPVFQGHGPLLVADHRAAEPALAVLDHQAALGLHLRHLALAGSPAAQRVPRREHVSAVLPAPHERLLSSVSSAGPAGKA